MISGHLATMLVGKRAAPDAPWWLLFVACNGPDVLMYAFVALGIETMELHPGHDGAMISSAVVEMTYSHDLLPVLGWTLLFGLAVWGIWRDRRLAMVCVALFVGHYVCDLFSGFGHFVYGPDSAPLGNDSYHTNLPLAVALEGLFGVACVAAATARTQTPWSRRAAMYLGFGLAPLALFI